jgi:hypothetical protein
VKALILIAVLLGGTGFAAAQDKVQPPAKADKTQHAAPLQLVPAHPPRAHRSAAAAPGSAIPEQFSPPQEAYASFPEVGAAAAAAPGKPSACQMRLAKLAAFRPLPMLVGAGECGATDAVLLDSVILPDKTKIPLSPPATLRCSIAEQIALWVRDDVAPAALKLGSPLRGVDNYDSYECRGRNRVRGATLSEHGRANALDVRGFNLADGKMIGLTDENVAREWRESLRASTCARFSTVLGPGSDGAHEEHIHVDLAERRNDYKTCAWEVREPVKQVAKQEAKPETEAGEADGTAAALAEPVPLPRPRPIAANAVEELRPPSKKAHSQAAPQL